jgi:hypothetical protein
MIPSTTNEKVHLNFVWEGPSSWQGGWTREGLDIRVVDLIFKNAKSKISVNIPENTPASTVKTLPFICRTYHETECEIKGRKFKPLAKETHPDILNVTIEQIRNLTIKAGIFEESPNHGPSFVDQFGKITREKRILRSDSDIKLELPEELEMGQTYSLVFTSKDFSFSARIQKEEKAKSSDSANFEDLSKDELQSRFEVAFTKDKEFETQRMRAYTSGNMKEVNRIFELESANSQLLIKLAETLEKKGFKAQIPQSESFRSADNESAEAHAEVIKGLEQSCKMQ